jgi:hypothetical protein
MHTCAAWQLNQSLSPHWHLRAQRASPRGLDARPASSGTLRLLMSYTTPAFAARAAAFQGMGMMLPAFTRAMGARMITTITTAAT